MQLNNGEKNLSSNWLGLNRFNLIENTERLLLEHTQYQQQIVIFLFGWFNRHGNGSCPSIDVTFWTKPSDGASFRMKTAIKTQADHRLTPNCDLLRIALFPDFIDMPIMRWVHKWPEPQLKTGSNRLNVLLLSATSTSTPQFQPKHVSEKHKPRSLVSPKQTFGYAKPSFSSSLCVSSRAKGKKREKPTAKPCI